MTTNPRDTISNYLVELTESTIHLVELLIHLVSKSVLTPNDMQIIENKPNDLQKNLQLYTMLLKMGPEAFDVLIAGLRKTGNIRLAYLLAGKTEEDIAEEIQRRNNRQEIRKIIIKGEIDASSNFQQFFHEISYRAEGDLTEIETVHAYWEKQITEKHQIDGYVCTGEEDIISQWRRKKTHHLVRATQEVTYSTTLRKNELSDPDPGETVHKKIVEKGSLVFHEKSEMSTRTDVNCPAAATFGSTGQENVQFVENTVKNIIGRFL